ncbi:hypothetical protein MK079_02405 [Candidatus Gracilibacteria bacterium]|nr:hypothetical protein [Candidatus Gracilibacteria bacterium]
MTDSYENNKLLCHALTQQGRAGNHIGLQRKKAADEELRRSNRFLGDNQKAARREKCRR